MTSISRFLIVAAICQISVSAAPSPTSANDEVGCAFSAQKMLQLNGPSLLKASETCLAASKNSDATFLRIVGQIRLITDLAILFPSSDSDDIKSRQFDELSEGYVDVPNYRDPEFARKLISKIETWVPAFDADYNPGWNFKKLISASTYHEFMKQNINRRLAIIRNQADLIARDDFYAITKEIRSIFKRNGNSIRGGTKDFLRVQELRKADSEIREHVQKPLPQVMFPQPSQFRSDLEPKHSVLFVGTNGPNYQVSQWFSDYDELEKSWLRYALTEIQMAKILNTIDFQRRQILAVAYGQKSKVTANPHFYKVSHNYTSKELSLISGLGLMEEGCQHTPSDSYPYAVIAIDEVTASWRNRMSYKYFDDGCKPPLSGSSSHEFR